MTFKTVHGSQESRPSETEYCGDKVLVRKNIQRVAIHDPLTETDIELWEYEEAYCSVNEYTDWVRDNQQSQIDYIAMMTDIDLPEV